MADSSPPSQGPHSRKTSTSTSTPTSTPTPKTSPPPRSTTPASDAPRSGRLLKEVFQLGNTFTPGHTKTKSMNRNRKDRSRREQQSQPEEEVQLWSKAKKATEEIVSDIKEDNARMKELLACDKKLGAMDPDEIAGEDLKEAEDHCRTGIKHTDALKAKIDAAIERAELLLALSAPSEATPTVLGKRSTAAREREKDKDKPAATAAGGSSVYDFDPGENSPVPSPAAGSSRGRNVDRSSNRDRDSLPPKAESVEPPSAGPGSAAVKTKVTFSKGDSVAFKPKSSNGETSMDWILGEVASVSGEGKSRRYKVLDVDPDEQASKKEYRSSASSMIPITPERLASTLPDWEPGKVVLALYPQTTTFYKAEVHGMADDGKVSLKFEGENDSETLQQVERRYVIEYRA